MRACLKDKIRPIAARSTVQSANDFHPKGGNAVSWWDGMNWPDLFCILTKPSTSSGAEKDRHGSGQVGREVFPTME